MSKNNHLEIVVKTTPLWSEYVADILIEKVGCSGIVSQEKQIQNDEIIKDETDLVKGYMSLIEDFDFAKLQELFKTEHQALVEAGVKAYDLGEWSVTKNEIAYDDWAENWKKFWHPMKIGKQIVICPSWEEYQAAENESVIKLDPGSAFGTGSHPTTRLCIKALDDVVNEFENEVAMADVGTGSGILAVAGIKQGIKTVVGVDNDASVINACIENAEKNGVSDNCTFYAGTASDIEGTYDIVVANILAEIIIEIMPDLKKLMKASGKMVLSGIIKRKQLDVEKSLAENGINVIDVIEEDNWVAIVANMT